MKIRLADYVMQRLIELGVRHAFLVTGGAAMHLNDAIGKCSGLEYICCHHEQACAMAAQAYFRLSGKPALVNVTSGPGSTNAITGVFGAWVNSEAVIVISGQVRRSTMMSNTVLQLRQLGDQEVDIVPMVSSITKYAVTVTNPLDIGHHIDRAFHLAITGRPGPIWLDIPVDVQGAIIDTDELTKYSPIVDMVPLSNAQESIDTIVSKLQSAKRPVILAGSGVRTSGAYERFRELVDALGFPVVTAFNGHDLLPNDHPLFAGRPGTVGDRPGNFAVQNADFLLVLGCRLNVRQIGYDHESFARHAWIAMVDIDEAELHKPTLRIDLPVHADLGDLIDEMLPRANECRCREHVAYLATCKGWQERYPVVLPEYRDSEGPINPYVFFERLFELLPDDAIVVTANGSACVMTFQAAKLKDGQRLFCDSGSAPMGFDLPAAIGACIASGRKRVVCIAGDGSIMMNLQELQTIAHNQLPISIFVLDNGGYHSIRQTQEAFGSCKVGFDCDSGVSHPNFDQMAQEFGISGKFLGTGLSIDKAIEWAITGDGPRLVHVEVDPTQPFSPKASSRKLEDGSIVSAPLEDMWPFLPREELRGNMVAEVAT